MKIAIVVSQFNQVITDPLLSGALSHLSELGVDPEKTDVISVPGAVEIPLIAKLLAKAKKYHAIICLGAVIRGETSHYDYVCEQVSVGCQQVMMEFEIPVIFGILTTENMDQAYDRVGGNEGHKGKEAADTAVIMIKEVEKLKKDEN